MLGFHPISALPISAVGRVAVTVTGPYFVAEAAVYVPGMVAGEVYLPGATVAAIFQPGAVAQEACPQ